MDLETTIFLNSTVFQWLVAAGWVFGSLLVGYFIHLVMRLVLPPLLNGHPRLVELFQELQRPLILLLSFGLGMRQAFQVLTPTFIMLSLGRAFVPVLIGMGVI